MIAAAYYNEIDPYAAAWLRNLIAKGLIAPGDVDERSIEDVSPTDLIGYTQCHFFAGIGVWSHALRAAGWPDDRPVWTGSCPCQPFSAAGKGDGFADERHLWPHFHWLIAQHRPARVFGEQVASRDADPWIDLVQTDLEALGYGVGAVPFPAAGIGAPHIRDRLYWVADADGGRQRRRTSEARDGRNAARLELERLRDAGRMDLPDHARLEGLGRGHQAEGGRVGTLRPAAAPGEFDGMADHARSGRREEHADAGRFAVGNRPEGLAAGSVHGGRDLRTGPTNGHWADADWLACRDGKWRPVEPGTFPLAHGAASRVGRLRAYGNAIVAQAATAFIVASEEAQLWL
jgi:DNA (cytosine-5)-methyltransferase 1